MQHLFLTSSIGVDGVGESIRKRLGHDKELKTVFINTPVEGDADQSDLSWVDDERNNLNKNGFVTFDYTITGKQIEQIEQDLADIDVLYVTGGNEFYFREQCNLSNFDNFVHHFVDNGGLYIGTSCGSIMAGTDMSPLKNLSDLSVVGDRVKTNGFGFVNFTVLPHWGSVEFRERWLSDNSFNYMFSEATPLIALNNYQYVEVKGSDYQIIDVRGEA